MSADYNYNDKTGEFKPPKGITSKPSKNTCNYNKTGEFKPPKGITSKPPQYQQKSPTKKDSSSNLRDSIIIAVISFVIFVIVVLTSGNDNIPLWFIFIIAIGCGVWAYFDS